MKRLILGSLLALPLLAMSQDKASAFFCLCGTSCYSHHFSMPRICFCIDTCCDPHGGPGFGPGPGYGPGYAGSAYGNPYAAGYPMPWFYQFPGNPYNWPYGYMPNPAAGGTPTAVQASYVPYTPYAPYAAYGPNGYGYGYGWPARSPADYYSPYAR